MERMTSIPLSPRGSFHESTHDYGDVFVQGGDTGYVFVSGGENYMTAFVECATAGAFLRGEGKTLAEADDACWTKLQAYLGCPGHEFEPRAYRNGGGICKHCGTFRSGVFTAEQLGLFCTSCGIPTLHTTGSKGDEPRCVAHDPAWPYFVGHIKAMRLYHGDEEAKEMYERLTKVAYYDAAPDPEALEWAYANLDMSDAPRPVVGPDGQS
jgi:hypothetical protein